MEFRASKIAAEQNAHALEYLTKNLDDEEAGRRLFGSLLEDLGCVVECYPEWHPILTTPSKKRHEDVYDLSSLPIYDGVDHTILFVRGFVTCPYVEEHAENLVRQVTEEGLDAYRIEGPLYANNAYPVVVEASNVILEADGTIKSRDAITWFVEKTINDIPRAQVAETWWNIHTMLLGSPHGARSSLFVNQYAGGHIRKILDVLNNSGIFGEIKESSLAMLSEKKRDKVARTLLEAALMARKNEGDEFEFELRGETCKATVSDTWGDGFELSIKVMIGSYDLYTSGHFYPKAKKLECSTPRGKRALAEKFL